MSPVTTTTILKIAVDKNAPVPAYQQVVSGITQAIERGDVDHGSRLPSVRNLALDLGLNVNTVARAYRTLESLGLVSYFWNRTYYPQYY